MLKSQKNILLIDDDPINNMINQKKIQKLNPELGVLVAESGKEGLKCCINEKPDLILLDINMPEMNGWEFMEEFVKLKLQIPVVIVTSSINKEDQERAKNYVLIKNYFVKPLSDDKIHELFKIVH